MDCFGLSTTDPQVKLADFDVSTLCPTDEDDAILEDDFLNIIGAKFCKYATGFQKFRDAFPLGVAHEEAAAQHDHRQPSCVERN